MMTNKITFDVDGPFKNSKSGIPTNKSSMPQQLCFDMRLSDKPFNAAK
jgi:hypothetical protein